MGKNRQEHKKNLYEFYIRHQRPEEFARDPLVYYTQDRVKEYATSKSLMRIQESITKRSLQLIDASPPATFLDIGMGCGYASLYLKLKGFRSFGFDINRLFLKFYNLTEINPIHADMRLVGLRANVADFIISISAVQWLLAEEDPVIRNKSLTAFANMCAYAVKPGGKVIIQFYPKSDKAMDELGHYFKETGHFTGNFIIDNPENPKKRRIFLYLEKKNKN